MQIRDALPSPFPGLLVSRLALSLFAITGIMVALAEWSVLPREALIVGAPAIVASMLVDTFLFNEFLIRTGDGLWIIVYAFIFLQSVVVAGLVKLLARHRPGGGERTAPN